MIECDRGRVTLSGIVDGDTELTLLADVAGAVPGVTNVENRVKSATPTRFRGEY